MGTGTGSAFGDLLRRHRNSASITQKDLAGRAGLTPQAIGLLEHGERRRPSLQRGQREAFLGRILGREHRQYLLA